MYRGKAWCLEAIFGGLLHFRAMGSTLGLQNACENSVIHEHVTYVYMCLYAGLYLQGF